MADERDAPGTGQDGPDRDGATDPCARADAAERRALALDRAVDRLRLALLGVADRHAEDDPYPCFCGGLPVESHEDWCVHARAALAATTPARRGRLPRVDDLLAAIGLGGADGGPRGDDARPATLADYPDRVLEQVKAGYSLGEPAADGDRVRCIHCGEVHALAAKHRLLWYRCSDGSHYLGGIDGRLLVPRAE
jgi:hypothetical protein